MNATSEKTENEEEKEKEKEREDDDVTDRQMTHQLM